MNRNIKHILSGVFICAVIMADSMAATGVRGAATQERGRASAPVVSRPNAQQNVSKRSSVSVIRAARGKDVSRTAVSANNRQGAFSRATNIISDAGRALIRGAFGSGTSQKNVSRAAVNTPARVANNNVSGGASRSRATAVFGDISKLGGAYNECREAYATCMDQFCAGANETYRRCFCSDTFRTLRDKEEALDAATAMLARFEDNNLNAVDKSAEEVNAMYSATAGEAAIKRDTSASAKLLDDIGDLLSGKKKPSAEASSVAALSMDLSFSSDLGDIWAGDSGDASSLFGGGGVDLASMEGTTLYNNAHNQCVKLVANQCSDSAARNMVKSAYSVFITQDCNAYQKKLNTKTEQIKTTVRTAEKYLREARLEEYRSHNSSDVNECMDKVEQAMLAPTACGASYERCMDPTGAYINMASGEAIYSPRLFKLNEVIVLDGQIGSDVLKQNPEFDRFLDEKRTFAKSALDTCRTISDTVWAEYKRNALIKIAQAQDEKIEEVKMSCVSTMKECYDAQSSALKGFDDTTAQASGALAARASRDMCADKVAACAALYSKNGSVACNVDRRTGVITNADVCGLASLRAFVDTVDDVRIAEGCETAVHKYLQDLCTPTTGDNGYPWNCRLRKMGTLNLTANYPASATNLDLADLVLKYAYENCAVKSGNTYEPLEARIQQQVQQEFDDMKDQLVDLVGGKCEEAGGIWTNKQEVNNNVNGLTNGDVIETFYSAVFGASREHANTEYEVDDLGVCLKNNVAARCNAENLRTGDRGWARYNAETGTCVFSIEYYQDQCNQVRGVWGSDGFCYVE